MKLKSLAVAVLMVVSLAACNRERGSVTGGYGDGVVTGQVIMADSLAGSSPEGVTVSVRGTGMSAVVGADGRFTFAGVPDGSQLSFTRADGVNASMSLTQTNGFVAVSLGVNSARPSKRRGIAPGTGKVQESEGVVRSVSATEMVIFDQRQGELTFKLEASTVIRKGDATVAATDVKPDDRVHVKATVADDVRTAVLVIVQRQGADDDGEDDDNPASAVKEYEGTVKSASATQLVVLDRRNGEVTFALDAATVIRKGQTTVLAADLEPDWRVHVRATTDGTTKKALLVIVQNENGGGDDDGDDEGGEHGGTTVTANGAVISVGSDSLVVGSQPHGEMTVKTDASTEIKKQGQTISLADIKAGDEVNCRGTRVSDNEMLAEQIEVRGSGGHK